ILEVGHGGSENLKSEDRSRKPAQLAEIRACERASTRLGKISLGDAEHFLDARGAVQDFSIPVLPQRRQPALQRMITDRRRAGAIDAQLPHTVIGAEQLEDRASSRVSRIAAVTAASRLPRAFRVGLREVARQVRRVGPILDLAMLAEDAYEPLRQ